MVVGQILPQHSPTTTASQLADDSRFAGGGHLLRSLGNGTGGASGTHLCTPFRQCHPAANQVLVRNKPVWFAKLSECV